MALPERGLNAHIWNNNLRSLFLLALYPLILAAVIWACAAVVGSGMAQTGNIHQPLNLSLVRTFANNALAEFWPAVLTVVAVWFIVSYLFHTNMVRMMAHSHPVSRAEEPELYNLLENLCISRGLTMPRLEIIETNALNAFASGVDKRSYAVTVTRGLLQSLSREEIEAVLAHELTHIMNRDVRLLMVCIIFTGMIGFGAQLVWSVLRYSWYVPRSRDRQGHGGMVFLLLALALVLWVGYLATLFTRFALSRRREYMADAGAVQLTRNPAAMMGALMRIAGHDRLPDTPADIAMMCIENSQPFLGLMATHPPIESRIRAIAETTGEPLPDIVSAPPPASRRSRNPWQRK